MTPGPDTVYNIVALPSLICIMSCVEEKSTICVAIVNNGRSTFRLYGTHLKIILLYK